MPATAKSISERAHERIDKIQKRLKLPFVPLSTRIFYDILSKNDKGYMDVKDICLPKPKAILQFESVEYVIPGLKVPIYEEDGNMDMAIEDYQEDMESDEEVSALGGTKTKVWKCQRNYPDITERQLHLPFQVNKILAKRIFQTLDNHLPQGMIKPSFFKSEKDVDAMVDSVFGVTEASESEITMKRKTKHDKGLLPEALETFEDMSSDEGISQMAFYGIGQVMLKKSDEAKPAAYQVMTESLSKVTRQILK